MDSITNYLEKNTVRNLTVKYAVPGHLLHEQHVCQHALKIFDFLTSHSSFFDSLVGEEQTSANNSIRDLLEKAALLHDLGHFINQKKHDYHTYHIIAYDYLLSAVPTKLKIMLALIAGGHRKKLHLQSAEQLTRLSARDKTIVKQLAAILRVADAIDYTRQPNLTISELHLSNQQLIIVLSDNYAAIVSERVQKKSALFQEVYGLTIELQALV